MNTAWGTVLRVIAERTGWMLLACSSDDGRERLAVCYPNLSGPAELGDRVLLNTTAVDLGLGTGGVDFVVARVSAKDRRGGGAGHIIKLRYTPLQTPVLSVEEPASPFHAAMRGADSLGGAPVVCCELLSQVPAALAGLSSSGPPLRAVLVMTDEAALPAAFSDLIHALRARGALAAVITAGQAFGGDLEAVNTHSGLLAARVAAKADVVFVSPGPGGVGTNTAWGFGGVAQGEAMNAAVALGGQAIGIVRASTADARARHGGISHHTRTVFTRVAVGPFSAAWPSGAGEAADRAWNALKAGTGARMASLVLTGGREALDAFDPTNALYRSMGRGRDEDPLFFEAAAAAGLLARRMHEENASDGRQDNAL